MFAALHPRFWGAHLLGALAVAAAVWLGVWQWNVGEGHRSSQVEDYAHAVPKPIASVITAGASFDGRQYGRPVRVTGQWVPGSTVFVKTGGTPAYWIATAVRSGSSSIYVVRGAYDRPQAECCGMLQNRPASLKADVVGWLQPDQSSTEPANGRILPVMSNGLAAPFASTTLLDAYVVASTPDGWMTAVPEPTLPKPDFWTGLRNISYALEWWTFGVFALIVWWRHVREGLGAPVRSGA